MEQRDYSYTVESLCLQSHPLIQAEILSAEVCFSKNLEVFLYLFPPLLPLTLKLPTPAIPGAGPSEANRQRWVILWQISICKKAPVLCPKLVLLHSSRDAEGTGCGVTRENGASDGSVQTPTSSCVGAAPSRTDGPRANARTDGRTSQGLTAPEGAHQPLQLSYQGLEKSNHPFCVGEAIVGCLHLGIPLSLPNFI